MCVCVSVGVCVCVCVFYFANLFLIDSEKNYEIAIGFYFSLKGHISYFVNITKYEHRVGPMHVFLLFHN